MVVNLKAPGLVDVDVLDSRDRLCRHLYHGVLPAGATRLRWDGLDASWRPVPPGAYQVLVRHGDLEQRSTVRVRAAE